MSTEKHIAGSSGGSDDAVQDADRRNLVRALAVTGCCLASGALTAPSALAQSKRVKLEPGQRFAHMAGDKEGQLVVPDDVKLGKALLVYPMDPKTPDVFGSRANLLLLMRLNEADIDEITKPQSAEGIVAYSGICTHEGCPISGEHENPRMALCNCHGSTFDLGKNGAVVAGPATRRLARLPIALTDGTLVIAGKLNGPIGPPA